MSHDPLYQQLRTIYGFDRFRGRQEEIIRLLIEGGDALVVMPTGGGKSLCFQLPALLRPGVGVVVSPLIALMQDQVDALRQLGVRAAFLNSSLSAQQAWAVEQALLGGELDLLYIAPERLLGERQLALLARTPIALFAIDEAHCVSQWGHDFRPEYMGLHVLGERFPGVPRVALTATADPATRREILERLGMTHATPFITGFDRPNIRYRVLPKEEPLKQLQRFLESGHPGDAGIVYRLSRKSVEETAAWLRTQGWEALPYHAGLSPATRRQHQERFLREEGVVMVATIAFGMGIDKPDVRFVAHLDLPKSMEAYYQETGRAGRDGEPADAWLLYGLQDMVALRGFIEKSEGSDTFKRVSHHKLDAMVGFCEAVACRREMILNYFGEPYPAPCNNCDSCLEPVATWDGTDAARRALSNVHRTGQRFGVAHLVDVLMGKETDKVLRLEHDKLSTFGIGKAVGLNARQWRSVHRQLVAAGLLTVDVTGHGALMLAEKCRPVLRGEQTVQLRMDPERKSRKGTRIRRRSGTFDHPWDDALWHALRAWRMTQANAQGVPPYVIMWDKVLQSLVIQRPATLDELAALEGFGQQRVKNYGPDLLACLARHREEHGARPADAPDLDDGSEEAGEREYRPPTPPRALRMNATMGETLALFRQGFGVAEIADFRGLKASTIEKHLGQLVAMEELTLEQVTGLGASGLARLKESLIPYLERPLAELPQELLARHPLATLIWTRAAMHRERQEEAD